MNSHSQASHTLPIPLLYHICRFASWTLNPRDPAWAWKTKVSLPHTS